MFKALFCASNAWNSSSHVGAHHLAKGLARRGWDVAFVSDPISPLHILGGLTPELKGRLRLYSSGGQRVFQGHIWAWVPGAVLTPQNKPLLRRKVVHEGWHQMAWPRMATTLRRVGFGNLDLVYVDSLTQAYWWQELGVGRSALRLADNPAGFTKHTPAADEALRRLAERVDLVACAAPTLVPLAQSIGARSVLTLPNGVDYAHFTTPAPKPLEYEGECRPIVLYVGALERWIAFDWLRHAASVLPDHCFVLVGPEKEANKHLRGLPNIRILGPRPFAAIPGYMQHATVGIIPFDVAGHGELIHHVNPLKLYEYMAAGLPVVASRWRVLEQQSSPAVLVDSAQAFVDALTKVPRPPVEGCRSYAQSYDWDSRVQVLLKALGLDG